MAALKKRNFIIIAIITLVIAIILSGFVYLNSQRSYTGSIESISIGIFPNELNSLIYLADNQQYFTNNGLKVSIKNYNTVLNAVDATLNGEVDISTASEFVLVQKAFNNESILTVATIDKVDQSSIIALKNKGITNIPDLTGKRIGVFKGSVNEFYLGRFLELNNMNINQIKVIDVSSKVVDFLDNGTVDAVLTGQPNISLLENIFGSGIVVFPAQNEQSANYNALCTNSWATSHPELIKRFLNSLSQAEQYVINNPTEAKTIIQNRLNYTFQYITNVWTDHRFSLSLDQSLILSMQDESRWLIQNNLTEATVVPNFTNYVDVNGLEAVKPASVTIIR